VTNKPTPREVLTTAMQGRRSGVLSFVAERLVHGGGFVFSSSGRSSSKENQDQPGIIRVRVAQKNCVTIATFFGLADFGKHSASA
jgi:hypothetical protein